MKVVCQVCEKVSSMHEAEGWMVEHWLGYRFTESEVLKIGVCPECKGKMFSKGKCKI